MTTTYRTYTPHPPLPQRATEIDARPPTDDARRVYDTLSLDAYDGHLLRILADSTRERWAYHDRADENYHHVARMLVDRACEKTRKPARLRAALFIRAHGHPWGEVAIHAGYPSPEAARKDVSAALNRMRGFLDSPPRGFGPRTKLRSSAEGAARRA